MGSKCWPNKMGEEVPGYSPPTTNPCSAQEASVSQVVTSCWPVIALFLG